jgi:hydroxymethylbilane synthase
MRSDGALRLGTRGSLLARTQSQWVAEQVTKSTGHAVELVLVKTRGDRIQDRPLDQVGGKGLFTKEIEEAMLAGEVDFAVHSMKDMPGEAPPNLIICAIPVREDPRDALVGKALCDLAPGAVVGTGSARRRAQLVEIRADLEVRGIRGNVPTRIRKMREGQYDAVVLAMAGLRRLGLGHEVSEALSPEQMLPATGQGALAVQCREDDAEVRGILSHVHHLPTATCIRAERGFLVEYGGGCSAPLACHAVLRDGELVVRAFLEGADGAAWRREARGTPEQAEELGRTLAQALRGLAEPD